MGLERELETSRKQSEADRKSIDELIRERDILNKNLVKAAGATQKQMNLVKLHEQSKKNLEQEIANYKEEAQKQRKLIHKLEKERDRYINEASELTQKVLQHMEDVKVREMQIFDYKKKIAEAETKLKQQQNLWVWFGGRWLESQGHAERWKKVVTNRWANPMGNDPVDPPTHRC